MLRERPSWMNSDNIRPYVMARKANRPSYPGTAYPFPWFKEEPLVIEPLEIASSPFFNQILRIDQKAFDANGLLTPRWVFYDCAIMPGFISGFAMRTETLPKEIKDKLTPPEELEWCPLSLFITIPTPEHGRWMAHNLGSMNSFVSKPMGLRGLGFLSKAFGLWYANIREQYGVAQWNSPALKLHANFGPLEIVTAYTPIHDYAGSITYRLWVDTEYWLHFLDKNDANVQFQDKFHDSGLTIDPMDTESLKGIQVRIEKEEGPFYIDPVEILNKPVGSYLKLYCRQQ